MKHQARKRFGQNFLIDPEIVRRIVEAVSPSHGDTIVEIGPGLGALTAPLLRAFGDDDLLHVVELDRDLAERLRGLSIRDRLVIHEIDVLRFDFAAIAPANAPLRIIGNLPYNISTPLLFYLQEFADRIRDQHFMLQREVVERMVAQPGDSAYGRMSVMLQVCYRMEALFEVPPEAFDPAPKVTSAVVRMVPLGSAAPRILDRLGFAHLVRAAFSQRRKMLRNTLSEFDLKVPMRGMGLDPSARAESISPALYVGYANALADFHGVAAP